MCNDEWCPIDLEKLNNKKDNSYIGENMVMEENVEKRIGECGEAIFDFHYFINQAQRYIDEGNWDMADKIIMQVDRSLRRMSSACKVDTIKALGYVGQAITALKGKELNATLTKNLLNASIGEMLWQFKMKKVI